MAKGDKGWLGRIADGVKAELLEDGDSAPEAAPATSKAAPPLAAAAPAQAPAPVASGTMPYTFGTTGGGPEPLDDKAVATVNEGVFVNINGRPSRYMLFMRMWETLGKPADTTIALKALQVNDSSLTAASVLEDINAHMKLLDGVAARADTEFAAAATERLGGADAEIQRLQEANQHAQAEIERHQQETSDRIGQITKLQTSRAGDEAAIARAKQRTEAAESAIRSQLQNMQQLFANLPS